MNSQYDKQSDADKSRDPDRSIKIGALVRRGWVRAVLAAAMMLTLASAVRAQQKVTLAAPVHTSTVTVTVGKTEDVRTDQNLTDITVGDPDIADVSP
ncbi:MAG TPA: pilus assembly protein N-terminal domain-containing protein, partial [Xanthobacteraceae bacterium]|nr:pilus assembly protein N-terminal domain-containing protein [Xanthobacteraceae bacterium]